MVSEKQIACVTDAIDFALGDIKKARLFVDRIELIRDVVRKALTAAEQAEPVPNTLVDTISDEVWGHDASKDNCLVVDSDGLSEPAPAADAPLGAVENGRVFLQRLVDHYDFQCEAGGLANCSDYHEAVRCFEAMAEWIYHHAPAARSGAVALPTHEPNEKLKAMWDDYEAVNKQKHPPESRLREALEEIANLKTVRDRPDDYNRGFADGRWQAVKIARAALAQEDGR